MFFFLTWVNKNLRIIQVRVWSTVKEEMYFLLTSRKLALDRRFKYHMLKALCDERKWEIEGLNQQSWECQMGITMKNICWIWKLKFSLTESRREVQEETAQQRSDFGESKEFLSQVSHALKGKSRRLFLSQAHSVLHWLLQNKSAVKRKKSNYRSEWTLVVR